MGVLEDKLKLLPSNPGVYVMLDADGVVIYVGKAKNLKNRVRQYFFNSVKTKKVMAMVSNVADFYYVIAPSEIDALSLENNLIKKHKPRYNILLKDDKTYPYLRIDLKENFPVFKIVRRIKKDGAKYFGPYMGGVNVHSVLETLNLLYGIRPCVKSLNANKILKPCLNHHISKCSAPCAGLISVEEYRERVKSAISFLSGDVENAEQILTDKMTAFAENEQFEIALKYKNAILGLEKLKLKRLTSLNKFLTADVIAYASNGIYSTINMLVIRQGRMLGSKNFSFESGAFDDEQVLSEFISRYYNSDSEVPDEIIVGTELSDEKTLKEYIKTVTGKSVEVVSAKMGVRRQLVDMAEINATEHLETAVDRIRHKDDMTVSACKKLKEVLNLKNFPHRMECYDISNISGVDKVGSMVVFTDGVADKTEYRRFKIKTFEGADDFRSLKEVLSRRLQKLLSEPDKFPKPDLMIIDGGKGQLSSVKEVLDEFNVTDVDLISLAERDEEIFLPNRSDPVLLNKSDYVLRLLQRIRDEAHRFAITYHRTLRGKRALSSVLDKVNGLGKIKRQKLIEEFGDLNGIIFASKEQLKKVDGIGDALADQIILTLTNEGLK